MNEPVSGSRAAQIEERLSGAYDRILRAAMVLGVAGALAASLLTGWRSGLGLAVGAIVASLNYVWLHHGTERIVQRMLSPTKKGASKFWLALSFLGRYLLVFAATYVIFKGYPRMLFGFIVGLVLPVIAAMGEGVYEAVVFSKTDQT